MNLKGSYQVVGREYREVVRSIFFHMTASRANLLEQNEVFTQEKSSILIELVWVTNMATVSIRLL